MTLALAVLVSGRGSNLRALHRAIEAGTCDAEIVGVVSDRPKCEALRFASEQGFGVGVVRRKAFDSRPAWDRALASAIEELSPELVVLAGFMRIVGDAVLARYGGRIVNVHPSLLPSFPGLNAPQQALDAGARVTGCSVHLVDSGVDTGDVLAQATLSIARDDDAESLHDRIQALEHALLPSVVHRIGTGEIEL